MELQITDQACVQWHNKCNIKVPWDMYVWCHCTRKYVHLDFTQFVITIFFVIFISYVWFGECNFSAGPIMCKKAMGRFWSRIGQKGQPLLLERAITLQEVCAASAASCSFLRFPDSRELPAHKPEVCDCRARGLLRLASEFWWSWSTKHQLWPHKKPFS